MSPHIVNNPDRIECTSILLTGDLVLDVPNAGYWLSGIAPAIREADVAIGHLEVPHTTRGLEMVGDVPAPGAPPENLDALRDCGFTAVTLAGNHISDCGTEGIADTIAALDTLGIAHCGAGLSLIAARRPAIVKHGARRIALFSYNCVGPEKGWADEGKAGCSYLRIETSDGSPIAPAAPLSTLTDEAVAMLRADIAAVGGAADLVIVALHKGIVHTPAKLAPYERALSHAAIEAGADVVIGHHAHIIRGIEFHLGKPIFHGLGNGCVVTYALSPDQAHPARAAWAAKRKAMFGFEPDPAYTLAPFHPEAVNGVLGRLIWHADGQIEAGFVPVHVEAPGRPTIADDATASRISAYVAKITSDAGLPPVTLTPRNDMVHAQ
jgi:poly-gamma-glutamate capsule biosynthesis protein CapA/YwtB (metallophosphatase superfamily)